ncbi:MAG TPA: hypothetical protein VMD99_04430 [Terriglobales bacterium]|nr:hypothetical protein [Terriglobales bacterium]
MELLSGWKEIAAHIHLGVRTAQRWERLGLPVRRVSGGHCSPVVAVPDEIELWARRKEAKATGYAIASGGLLAAKSSELWAAQRKTVRRTRRLTKQLDSLQLEQEKLLLAIRSNLIESGRSNLKDRTGTIESE